MQFNSPEYLVFFPIVVLLFYVTPHRYRWLLLLVASYFFYMSWEPAYGLLILFSTLNDYVAGRYMEHAQGGRRKLYLALSLFGNLGMLFIFKYFNFFFETFNSLLSLLKIEYHSPALSLLLPVGISFITFQSLSYTIDVYRGLRPAEKHFGIFALYVSFFPQLVAGPIGNSRHLLPQFYSPVVFNRERIVSGLRLSLWGFFKKIVIADNAGRIVGSLYSNYTEASGLALFFGTVFFAIQIYTDFSAYSDIARGSARIMGYDLMLNFRQPYFARTVRDFWSRWHISLMKWFQEYVYFPLGGGRVSEIKVFRNIFIIFFISGLWHGANWTFIVWGLLNALYMIGERFFSLPKQNVGVMQKIQTSFKTHILHGLQIIFTFILILISWIFFRSDSIEMAHYILSKIIFDMIFIAIHPSHLFSMILGIKSFIHMSLDSFIALLIAIAILLMVDFLSENGLLQKTIHRAPNLVRVSVYYVIILYIVLYGYFGETTFIYFQF